MHIILYSRTEAFTFNGTFLCGNITKVQLYHRKFIPDSEEEKEPLHTEMRR